ncbi:MAG TPA: tetraacyldisaccharide 4'-kinase [Candidatus Acidoferrales bacterium]
MKFTEAILWPASLLYGAAASLKARAYRAGWRKPRSLNGIVVSVGNLTVGGTGKTPLVLWIAQKWLDEGEKVGILTRGYRGKAVAPAQNHTGDLTTSDEVRLLKQRLGDYVSVGIGANRFEKGQQLASQDIDHFVLDDGFQHLQLARNVDIVLIDALNPFGGGHLLPAGRLREPLSALGRADLVVINRTSNSPAIETVIRRNSQAAIFYAQPKIESIRSMLDNQITDRSFDLKGVKAFAFCGIGNPQGFLATLRDSGAAIVGHRFFPDHHRYTGRDAARIYSEAAACGASVLVCTEKDLYNLNASFRGNLPLVCVTISLGIQREDEFWHQINSIAKQRKQKT